MHNNYYFLKQLSSALSRRVAGGFIAECFSQQKDELVVRFETGKDTLYLRASLLPTFTCLSFSDDYQRTRKNSVDLFGSFIGVPIVNVHQYLEERAFAIIFSNEAKLLFKMHGNKANVIEIKDDQVVHLFRSSLVADSTINPLALDRHIDWSYEAFQRQTDPKTAYFTLGKVPWVYLREKEFESLGAGQQWHLLSEVKRLLDNAGTFYLTRLRGQLTLSLLPVGEILETHDDPLEAVTRFCQQSYQEQAFTRELLGVRAQLTRRIKSTEQYLHKAEARLNELKHDSHFKQWADLLMANLHNIPAGAQSASVADFYHDQRVIDIPLKPTLSAQQNAALYYGKAKKQHLEVEHLQGTITTKTTALLTLQRDMEALESVGNLRALRAWLKQDKKAERKDPGEKALPFHDYAFNTFKILVGKNAQANDLLTLKHTYKDDLWLHAKDVAGSHVVIKYQAGKPFPKDVIERAAQLAAFYSKRKNDTLCPVTVTPKKFVRKRKGDPPGAVVVEREEVILVEPRGFD